MNNSYQQIKAPKLKPRAPLFASPWMALYMVLRNELSQSRSGN
jgi:tryptophan-rich sensory protein